VPFNLRFNSGVMRARFNTRDGQLYLCGLKGWQNAATRDGGFYRVRYTGKPVRMPVKAHVAQNGVQLKFSCDLDAKSAGDPQSYNVELWNYRYSGAYGSPEFSVKEPGKARHDTLTVKSASLGADKRTVFLEIEGLQPADQYSVKYTVNAADGTEVRSEIVGTIHKLGAALTASR
jgi:ribosomal protein L35AE/L33A